MATETELVNAALRKVGGKRIMDITDDVGSAGVAGDVLAFERDELLRLSTWNFAATRAHLAPLEVTPVFEWEYAFAVPSDCMRIVGVYDNDAGTSQAFYKIESIETDEGYVNAILGDVNEIWLRYIRRVTDVGLMSEGFRQCLILRLAKVFAISIAKSNQLYSGLDEEYKTALRAARSIDGIEDRIDQIPEGSWANSRRGRWNRQGWPGNWRA